MTFRRKFERCHRNRTYLKMRLPAKFEQHFGVQFTGASALEIAGAARTGTPDGTGSQHE